MCTYLGGVNSICMDQKMLIEYSLKALINVCHQSAKKGRLKVYLGPSGFWCIEGQLD
jgi:hypothetical protein